MSSGWWRPLASLRRLYPWLCLCVALPLVGCKQQTKPQPDGGSPVAREPVSAADKLFAAMRKGAKVDPAWRKDSWVNYVLTQPSAIPSFFGKSAERRADLAALWNNGWVKAAAKTPAIKSLTASHAAIRARLMLRLARFYHAAYRLASDLNLGRLSKRAERAKKKLKAGKLFHYHYGRQLCLSGYRAKARKALAKAMKEVPSNRADRVRLWQRVCDPAKISKDAMASGLKSLTFAGDPDGVVERWLAAVVFSLPLAIPKSGATTPRGKLFQQLLHGVGAVPQSKLLRGVVETEEIKEGEITATLEYFDPGILWALSRHAALRALALLKAAPAKQPFAPFYMAHAYAFIGDMGKARDAMKAFVASPPKSIDLAYMLFSRRLSLRSYITEAKIWLAVWDIDANFAKKRLKALAKGTYPMASLAYLQWMEASPKDEKLRDKAYAALRVGAQIAGKTSKEWFVELTKATEANTKKNATDAQKSAAMARAQAAGALVKWQLHRYAVRPLYLWAVQGALAAGDVERAVRWAEQLHRKDSPYELGGRNEAFQFILTARAYILAGKMGIATLYFAKSKNMYPALTQLWSLLRILRIYRGTEGGSVIVMPKGG